MANRALERAGRSERIDHRTLAEQGIERMPTEHNGPAITEMVRDGRPSRVIEDREAAASAFVAQVKAEAQALADDLAKAQAAFDQAQQEVDQLKAEQQREQMRRERAEYEKREAEDKRLKALPAEQLAREVNRMRNALTSPDAAAQRDPAYIERGSERRIWRSRSGRPIRSRPRWSGKPSSSGRSTAFGRGCTIPA